jgi:hypothetical protein
MFALLALGSGGPTDAPWVFTVKGSDLVASKALLQQNDPDLTPALSVLQKEADKALEEGPFSVVNKPATPPSGDKHDYMSLSPYWWPNPDKSDGLPYIRKDGVVNPEREKFDLPLIENFTTNTHTLALAYYFTGDAKYATKAADQMRAWFFDEATRMNPNVRYAQVVRGVEEDGRANGVLEADRFRRIIDADALLAGSKSWTANDSAKLREWFKQFDTYLRTSEQGKKELAQKNNHGSWAAVQMATYALYLGDDARAKELIETEGRKRIASQIEPDGSQPFELERTKAFDYSRYNLMALMQLATLGERVGVDLWYYKTEDGRSIRAAIDWLTPYGTGQKQWEHQQITDPKIADLFNILRRAAIAYHEPKYEELAQKVPGAGQESSRINLLYPKPKF